MGKLLLDTHAEQAIAYTDGSCIGNPGPCGAGAIIYTETVKPAVRLRRPVAQRGSILLAELVAIILVLEYIITENMHRAINSLKIYTDSQSVVGLLTLNYIPKHYIDVIRDIKEYVEDLRLKGVTTTIMWTPGHAGIAGTDAADSLAKEAAEEAKLLPPDINIMTLQDIKTGAQKSTDTKWQRRWSIGERGRDLYEKQPSVNNKPFFDHPTKQHFMAFIQLRTGYSSLNNYTSKFDEINRPPFCQCGQRETEHHFLLECQLYEDAREKMLQRITTELGIRNINMASLLTPFDGEKRPTKMNKLQILAEFIDQTGRLKTLTQS